VSDQPAGDETGDQEVDDQQCVGDHAAMEKDARFPRLTEETMTPLQREVAKEIAAGPRGEVRGPFIPLMHHPELARRIQQLGEQLRWKGKLPPALLEFAVLMTARRWSCQHEWFVHEKLAQKAGLPPAIIEAIRIRQQPKGMSAEQSAVYAFCSEAHGTGRVGDAAFQAVQKLFGRDGAVELLVISGYYSMMAMVLNTASMPLAGGAEPPLQ
jgi:4-carboxymuconolactone decarboxylase